MARSCGGLRASRSGARVASSLARASADAVKPWYRLLEVAPPTSSLPSILDRSFVRGCSAVSGDVCVAPKTPNKERRDDSRGREAVGNAKPGCEEGERSSARLTASHRRKLLNMPQLTRRSLTDLWSYKAPGQICLIISGRSERRGECEVRRAWSSIRVLEVQQGAIALGGTLSLDLGCV